ncbi:hypothetical protein GLOIN_2v1489214 [Rhizophagus irregularis DAOM 181602=DAOM 197198]|uniref:Uncharacterized protein n=1 Tax=Rhizophagus irregularis (strain DAOM 181602 / DAOM 197198 / MUCL 43194) TaxID=747089 RepID=A0A2P4NWW2_RHIID|nr:hypothetical protein GLOIN_2v1489214 [Rhizophagus irregularis DAOM 181602=DAOM 197198]POG57626.1 hypothetical protein GLOIN_2v1489214 [Rhizophagus irregularis DAOM 181602=DAOM 197198]|eukprot:XP_025164492.1 hypothetical protein GLOIN_2v1489214 [Rhizophagus irregularis DAOM 181602=DAOM 197198]
MGKKRHECCCDHKLSVFFGGKNTKELKGIKSKDVKGWLKNRFSYNFVHVRKDPDWWYGVVHFENDDNKTRFYNFVRNQKFIGPLSKTIMFAEACPKSEDYDDYDEYDDDDEMDDLCLIVDIFIFNVKNLSVDVNINNTKLIFVKFEYDLPKDLEGSHCLLREAVFPDKEVILNLELPKRQVYILN